MEVTSPMKPAVNNLLTSLCRLHHDWFIIAMETAERHLLECSGTTRASVLQSLAHSSLSDQCMAMLLGSSALSLVLNSLRNSLQLLDDAKVHSYNSILGNVCTDIAFLTTLAFGHSMAQEWLVQESNAFFWPELLKRFSEPHPFNGEELSFCQHTVQQFFAVCIKFNKQGKQLFTNLLINALLGIYSLEPVSDITGPCNNFKLTPFTRTLLIDHLLGPEAVHMIVKINPAVMASDQQRIKVTSLIPTYDSPHYHPSYPIIGNHYYLKLSSENTLGRILGLIGHEEPPMKVKESKLAAQIKMKKATDVSKNKALPPETSKPFINIFNLSFMKAFDHPFKSSTDAHIAFSTPETHCVSLQPNTKTRQVPPSREYGCSHTRAITLSVPTTDHKKSSDPYPYVSMLEVFANCGGLRILAHLLSQLYPLLWPSDPIYKSQLVKNIDVSSLPTLSLASFLPTNSYVMLCLGLRLQQYGELICSSGMIGNVWYLFRGILGASEECMFCISNIKV